LLLFTICTLVGNDSTKGEQVGPERLEATVQAAFLALIPIATTVLLITLASRAADGRLQRNSWVGIRGPSTMRSDQAWVAGHRAALRLTPLYLLSTGVTLTALFAAVLWASVNVVMLVLQP
jgi:hypothetical protein